MFKHQVLLAAFVAVSAFAGAAAPSMAESHAREAVSVAVLKSNAQPFSDTLIMRGRTEATRSVEVRSEIGGLIASEPLPKGIAVKAGDVLCEIAPGDRPAELTEARARLEEARIEFEAASSLSKKGFASQTTANAKTAALEAARARVLRAELNLQHLEIRAPFDGLLVGDTAELGSFMQPGSICATVMTLDPIKIVAFAPERSVDQLRTGAGVQARLITGREVKGQITYVARSADRDTRTYLVEASVANDDLSIRDGMTAEMRVGLDGVMAHYLPQSSLTLDNDGALGVRIATDGVVRFAPVQILKDEPEGVWVAGLAAETDVIVVGQEFVTEGQPVQVTYVARGAF